MLNKEKATSPLEIGELFMTAFKLDQRKNPEIVSTFAFIISFGPQ